MTLKTLNNDHSSKEYWDDRFKKNGSWETRNGPTQTTIFARNFVARAKIPFDRFSLLDVGCALGDAINVFQHAWPNAVFSGCDISPVCIERCKRAFINGAAFFVSSIEQLKGFWDVIYCSNVLEHFPDPIEKAGSLLRHCRILCVMVPLEETTHNAPLAPDSNEEHLYTFCRRSFDRLVSQGLAANVTCSVFDCPPAWGWSLERKFRHAAHCLKHGKFSETFRFPKQALFRITASVPKELLHGK